MESDGSILYFLVVERLDFRILRYVHFTKTPESLSFHDDWDPPSQVSYLNLINIGGCFRLFSYDIKFSVG